MTPMSARALAPRRPYHVARPRNTLLACGLMLLALFAPLHVAHGHGGEDHSHEQTAAAQTVSASRLAVEGEQLEAVLVRDADGLRIWLDDKASNAAISRAQLQLELAGAVHEPREESPGVYRLDGHFDDTELAVVLTVINGESVDVLSGILPAPAMDHDQAAHADDAGTETGTGAQISVWWLLPVSVIALLAGLWLRRTPRARSATAHGAVLLALSAALLMPAPRSEAHGGEDHGDENKAAKPAHRGDRPQRLANGDLFVPKATQRLIGLRTEPVQFADHLQVFDWPASVVSDPESSQSVHAPQHAHVHGKLPRPGQLVKKGERLFSLQPVLTTTERQTLIAQQQGVSARLEALDARLLRLQGIEQLLSQHDRDQLQVEQRSLRAEKLALDRALSGKIELLAEHDGVIVSVHVQAGDTVDDGTVMAVLRSRDRIAVRAEAFSDDLPELKDGEFIWSGGRLPLRWHATALSREQQTLPVYFLNTESGVLPALNTVGRVRVSSSNSQRAIRVPESAVQRGDQGERLVWIKLAPEQFAARKVRALPGSDGALLITDGIADGARLVIAGNALLDSIK